MFQCHSGKTHTMQSLGETSQSVASAAEVESTGTHLRSLPICHLWPWVKWQIPFSVLFFYKNRRIQHKLMFCRCKNTSALGVPAQVPGCCRRDRSCPMPGAGHASQLQPAHCGAQLSPTATLESASGKVCFRKDKKMPVEQQGMRGKKCEKQLWKYPGHPRRRQEVVSSALGRISWQPTEKPGQFRWIWLHIYLALKLPAIKKKILPVWGHFSGLEMSPLMLFCYC